MVKWINKLFGAGDTTLPVEPTPSESPEKTGTQFRDNFQWDRIGFFYKVSLMRANSTLALARAVAHAPIRSARYSFKSKDEVGKDRVQAISDAILPLLPELIRNMLYGQDYGYKPFEIVWGRPLYTPNLLAPVKMKPLSVEKTEVFTDKKTGQYAGLKNERVELDPVYTLWYTHDKEDDNFFGRSRLKNCVIDYDAWMRITERQGSYVDLVASPIPLIEYPPGRTKDVNGVAQPNYDIAQKVLNNLSKGRGVYMPNDMVRWARELIERGADPGKLKAWVISFIEAKANHGGDFVEQLRHRESGMMRGYIVPERTAVEGQFGTKAEAVVHTNVALQMCDLVIREVVTYINWYVVDRILAFNYGPETIGSVWLEHAPITDEQLITLKTIFMQVLSNNPNYLRAWVDVDLALEKIGLPKAAESVADAVIKDDKQDDKNTREELTASFSRFLDKYLKE